MSDYPFSKEIFPNIQSKLPLTQLEAIASRPIASYLGGETNTCLTTTTFQVLQRLVKAWCLLHSCGEAQGCGRESCSNLQTCVSWTRKAVAVEYKHKIGEELLQIYMLADKTSVGDLSLFCTSLNACIPCHWQFVLVLLNS